MDFLLDGNEKGKNSQEATASNFVKPPIVWGVLCEPGSPISQTVSSPPRKTFLNKEKKRPELERTSVHLAPGCVRNEDGTESRKQPQEHTAGKASSLHTGLFSYGLLHREPSPPEHSLLISRNRRRGQCVSHGVFVRTTKPNRARRGWPARHEFKES